MGSEDDNDEALVALREALASRGLNTRGTFAQLEERLVDAIAAEQSAAEVEVNTLSVKELKDLITKARMTFEDCIDKADLKVRATEALAALATAKAAHQPMFAEDTRFGQSRMLRNLNQTEVKRRRNRQRWFNAFRPSL